MQAIGITLFESKKFGGPKISGGVANTLRANKVCAGVIEVTGMSDVKIVGSLESKFESTNRIYDTSGVSPTLSTMQGGNQEPKILEATTIKMVRTEEGKRLRKQYEQHEIHHGFNEHRKPELREDYCANTLSTVQKDNIVCCAMRGRNPDNPSDRTAGAPTQQRLELNNKGTCNTLTSVQKDNMVIERLGQISSDGSQCGTVISENGISSNLVAGTHGYANSHIATQLRIRKLTPRECGRLMDVADEDISKMAAVNSNSQLYKQFGNSIVVAVMVAMFRNLNIEQE